MKKSVFVTTLTALTLFAAGEANASVPVVGPYGSAITIIPTGFDCEANPEVQLQLDTGASLGWEAVNTAWNSGPHQDRSNVAQFLTDVVSIVNANAQLGLSGLDVNNEFDSYVACRFAGFVGGAIVGVADVLADTVLSCSADGLYWADFAARLYCELSEASNGLVAPAIVRPPSSNVCGVAFESTCKAAFPVNANAYVTDQGVSCQTWITGNTAVFEAHRDESCTYGS